jgi:putative FmdB family regulatory protein
MPLYEYRCENGHTFEVMQRMSDEPVTTCPDCGASVQRVFHPVAVHFKGSGFYNTDYGKKKKGAAVSEDSGGSSDTKKESTAKPAKSDSPSGSSSSTPSKSD